VEQLRADLDLAHRGLFYRILSPDMVCKMKVKKKKRVGCEGEDEKK
jgi:hypothetical protein